MTSAHRKSAFFSQILPFLVLVLCTFKHRSSIPHSSSCFLLFFCHSCLFVPNYCTYIFRIISIYSTFKHIFKAPCGNTPAGLNYVTMLFIGLVAWALLYAVLEHEVEPGGQLFLLIMLAIVAYTCGWVVSLLRLPPLLGMLLCGIGVRNLGLFRMTGVYVDVVRTIR